MSTHKQRLDHIWLTNKNARCSAAGVLRQVKRQAIPGPIFPQDSFRIRETSPRPYCFGRRISQVVGMDISSIGNLLTV